MYKKLILFSLLIAPIICLGGSSGGFHGLNGEDLSIFWVIPFVGILLSIAIFPLVLPDFGTITLVKFLYSGQVFSFCPYFFIMD